MKTSRRRRRPALDCLEPRVVLSQVTAEVSAKAAATPFPLSEAATLKKGLPVEDLITTTFDDGTIQRDVRLVVPDLANNTVSTTQSIQLRGGAGYQTITDVATTKGAITTQVNTTANPDGSSILEAVTDIQRGNTTSFRAVVLPSAGGATQLSGTVVKRGSSTVTNELSVAPDGTVTKIHIVAITESNGSVDTTTQVTPPTTPVTTTHSVSTTQRLQPPGS